ncbi:DUF5696 domain-containing protein [Paenibacillus spongiae]|uniref:DUF5696 domain-containing protein n=1 Tax=Paenibacillus spongiae TaxID=2909671 RepID=A0ABY5S6E0_9BACL|nr:DUF5696 domain-containing protein [Paenibacillus spongiae]UVI29150.1 DUF5696 domain-containing protein [Paenibacillus spongiae]
MKRTKRYAVLTVLLAAAVVAALPIFSQAEEADKAEPAAETGVEAAEESVAEPEVETSVEAAEESAAEPVAEAAEETDAGAAKEAVPDAAAGTASTATGTAVPKTNPVSATKKMASNGIYTLYADEKTGNVRVVNDATGSEWLGAPLTDKKTTPANKRYMESPVLISYTEGAEKTSTYPAKEKGTKVAVKPVESGLRVDYDIVKLKLKLALEYRLLDNGIEVTIPEESIVEAGAARLVSLEVMPFMNAARGSDDGAILLPDGSGALIRFKEKHAPYFAGYSQPIYGPDLTFRTQYNDTIDAAWLHKLSPREKIALPVFGIYKNGIGALGIVTKGEFAANINATPSGIRSIPFYRVSAEFIYRNDDVIFIGATGRVPLFQGNRIAGDRAVRFLLLEGEEANYVGMAKAYRNYLIRELGVKPVASNGTSLNLRLFGGILRDEVIGKTFISMTTFEQVRTVIDAFAKRGMTQLDLTITGWNDDGQYGNQPEQFPVSKPLGGRKELKKLIEYAGSKGIRLFLNADYVRVNSESDGFNKRKDSIHGIDREVLTTYDYFVSSGWGNPDRTFYLMKPERVLNKHINADLDEYADLGAAGVSFAGLGDSLYSDQDTDLLTQRDQSAGAWRKALELYRGRLGAVAVDYGFAYTFGSVDRIDGAPLDSSHFIFADETVPFYQLVLHGLIPYSASPGNLRDDSIAQRLRMLEYGAIPSFELTFEETSRLQRTMEDRLFSSLYTDWLGPAQEEYEAFRYIAERTMNEQMVNHEKLGAYVYRTTYSGGLQVIVNYGTQAVTVDDVSVEPLKYAVAGVDR